MSKAVKQQFAWTKFLRFYAEENIERRTRLGVFENGVDFWIEDGLPLTGIDFDTHDNLLTVELMLGDAFTHTIKNVQKIQIGFSPDELNDGLDITDGEGKTTVLRFEN